MGRPVKESNEDLAVTVTAVASGQKEMCNHGAKLKPTNLPLTGC